MQAKTQIRVFMRYEYYSSIGDERADLDFRRLEELAKEGRHVSTEINEAINIDGRT